MVSIIIFVLIFRLCGLVKYGIMIIERGIIMACIFFYRMELIDQLPLNVSKEGEGLKTYCAKFANLSF